MDVAADEGLEALTVRELQIHLAAVAFDQAKGVKLARGAVVNQRAEVAPVDIEPFARAGLHANVSAAGDGVLAKQRAR